MIDKLLWRCPVCKTNDAITHRRRRFRSDRVSCEACGSAWELHRVVGGPDFRLIATDGSLAGTDQPLAEWYDMMKEDFILVPLDESPAALAEDEALYLAGHSEILSVSQLDPRFEAAVANLEEKPAERGPGFVDLGECDLFLTDRRLIVCLGGLSYDLPLATIRSIMLLIDRYVIIRHQHRLVEVFEFREESSLKWRAYLDHALRPLAQTHGFKVHIAYD